MRDDMRDADRNRAPGAGRSARAQMSPEERGQLRRDIEDANRQTCGAKRQALYSVWLRAGSFAAGPEE